MNHEYTKIQMDRELALRFLPVLLMDEREPFPVEGVGYTVFRESGSSLSAGREIELDRRGRKSCIEYAVYFDYDIQHLYDLEHIWVYLDEWETVVDCESSFHGLYVNDWDLGKELLWQTQRVHLYCQAGKHALMPSPELFALFREYRECCGKTAGRDGILDPGILDDFLPFTEEDKAKMHRYIRENYCFQPSGKYMETEISPDRIMRWQDLKRLIPPRIRKELARLENYSGKAADKEG